MGCAQGAQGAQGAGGRSGPGGPPDAGCPAPLESPEPPEPQLELLEPEGAAEAALSTRLSVKALVITDASTPGKPEDFYDVKDELGRGSYGCVFEAVMRSTGEPRALKRIAKSGSSVIERGIKKIKAEIDVMRPLDHPNVVKLHETFEDRRCVSLVLELCRGPSLQHALDTRGSALPEDEAVPLMRQLLDCIQYLHEQLVCHRDVKPENMLFSEPIVDERFPATGLKLADFGLACRFPRPRAPTTDQQQLFRRELPLSEKVGTPEFVAPEVLSGHYDHLCDLYSCGIIMHMLITGGHPFLAVAPPSRHPSRCGGGRSEAPPPPLRVLPEPSPIHDSGDFLGGPLELVTPEARHLTMRMLAPRPQDRVSATKALMHLWFVMEHVSTAVRLEDEPASPFSQCQCFGERPCLEEDGGRASRRGKGASSGWSAPWAWCTAAGG